MSSRESYILDMHAILAYTDSSMPVSAKAPRWLYRLAIKRHRIQRRMHWFFSMARYARDFAIEDLPMTVFRHKSLLLRKLGDADMRLQHNKITNLKIASECLHRIVIKPGETFSFWKLVGEPTERRGFVEGMLLSQGEVVAGIGGGLCQLANLLYWIALHSPLTVVERYRHSFDPFPDSGRVLPFGSGATIFYNYIDLQFRNDTGAMFEFLVWVDETHLQGELRSDALPSQTYHVIEKSHRFLRERATNLFFRANELYQQICDRRTGNIIEERLICKNHSRMKYQPPEGAVVEEV